MHVNAKKMGFKFELFEQVFSIHAYLSILDCEVLFKLFKSGKYIIYISTMHNFITNENNYIFKGMHLIV